MKTATFQDITTRGDGAIAIQWSKPFGSITVQGNLLTRGDSLIVQGTATTEGAGIDPYEFAATPACISLFEVGGKPVTA